MLYLSTIKTISWSLVFTLHKKTDKVLDGHTDSCGCSDEGLTLETSANTLFTALSIKFTTCLRPSLTHSLYDLLQTIVYDSLWPALLNYEASVLITNVQLIVTPSSMVDGVNMPAAMTAWRNSVPVIVSEIVSGLFIDLLIVTGNSKG